MRKIQGLPDGTDITQLYRYRQAKQEVNNELTHRKNDDVVLGICCYHVLSGVGYA